MQCLVGKVKQQAVALEYAGAQLSVEDEDIMNRSVAVHKLDCANLLANVHSASHANHMATSYGLKTKALFQEHKLLHQSANVAKHEHFGVRHNTRFSVLPPPPPPAMPESSGAIQHILYSTKPQPDPPPLLPPPAPPTLPGLHSAIACADLEALGWASFRWGG